eukprot:5809480-Pyramimonas_sp.AAC.1
MHAQGAAVVVAPVGPRVVFAPLFLSVCLPVCLPVRPRALFAPLSLSVCRTEGVVCASFPPRSQTWSIVETSWAPAQAGSRTEPSTAARRSPRRRCACTCQGFTRTVSPC